MRLGHTHRLVLWHTHARTRHQTQQRITALGWRCCSKWWWECTLFRVAIFATDMMTSRVVYISVSAACSLLVTSFTPSGIEYCFFSFKSSQLWRFSLGWSGPKNMFITGWIPSCLQIISAKKLKGTKSTDPTRKNHPLTWLFFDALERRDIAVWRRYIMTDITYNRCTPNQRRTQKGVKWFISQNCQNWTWQLMQNMLLI